MSVLEEGSSLPGPGPIARPTEILRPDENGLTQGARILREGGLVAFPTETVYGLGADAAYPRAVAALYAAKERPRFNPLIAHVADLASARREGVFDRTAERLAEAFWPGPLTLVVPAATSGRVCDLARAGLASVALRLPAHPFARALVLRAGSPIVAPSANRSGRVSPTAASHVHADLDGRIDAVVDGGSCAVGLESTIVSCLDRDARLLRPGGIAREAIEEVLGYVSAAKQDDAERPLAPGALASHYAPRAQVRLEVNRIDEGEAVLLFGSDPPTGVDKAGPALNLSPGGDTTEAAANLFEFLRRLDATGARTIAVAPVPRSGLGEAINDRLRRAAADR